MNRFVTAGLTLLVWAGIQTQLLAGYDPNQGRWLSRDPIGEDGGLNLYGYVSNNPVSFVDPSGLTWQTNASFFGSWLTGGGSSNRQYGPGDVETQETAASLGAQQLRAAFKKSGCTGANGVAYGSAQAAWDTLLNPATLDWSSTAAQVGGFAGASAVNNGNGTVTYTIPNVAGTHSFFYHLVPDRQGTTGPMRNINQVFTWTEPIGGGDGGGCGCK